MTNTDETKSQLPDRTKCCVRFGDVRDSKIRDVIAPALQHINGEVQTHTHTHTHLCALRLVSGVVHLKAKRSTPCRNNSSVHTQLTQSSRKVRHIFIYVLETQCVYREVTIKLPWFTRLVAILSARWPRFDLKAVHVRFVVDKVALGQVPFPALRFPLSLPFHQGSVFTFILILFLS